MDQLITSNPQLSPLHHHDQVIAGSPIIWLYTGDVMLIQSTYSLVQCIHGVIHDSITLEQVFTSITQYTAYTPHTPR